MRRAVVLIFFLAFFLGTGVKAQPSVSVQGNVGAAFFQSPSGLSDILNSGVNLEFGTGVQVYEGLEVVLQGSYDRFTLNGDNLTLFNQNLPVEAEVEGGAFTLLNATLGLRYTLQNQGSAHPYVSGGMGIYRTTLSEARISQSNETLPGRATTGKGYHATLGTKFQIDETYSFFFGPRYVIVDTNESELQTSTSTRYVTLRLGVEVQL